MALKIFVLFQIAMVGNGMEGFRYSVQNGDARQLRSPIGTFIPSPQFQPQYNTTTMNRAALPTEGFVYVNLFFSLHKPSQAHACFL